MDHSARTSRSGAALLKQPVGAALADGVGP